MNIVDKILGAMIGKTPSPDVKACIDSEWFDLLSKQLEEYDMALNHHIHYVVIEDGSPNGYACCSEKEVTAFLRGLRTQREDWPYTKKDKGAWIYKKGDDPIPQYTPPECNELGSITKLTQAKHPGAQDGRKSKL